MPGLYVDVDSEQAEAYLKFLPDAVKKAIELKMDEVAEFALETMKREAPMSTGRLRRSIVKARVLTGPHSWGIMPMAPYAKFVERGTAPHEIRPVKAKALRWFAPVGRVAPGLGMGKATVFAKHVFHPGTPANPFVARTREIVQNVIMDMVRAGLREAIETLGVRPY